MLESAIFSRLFPYTAKRQPVADEVSFDDIAISAPDERVNVEEVDYNDDPPQYDWSGQRIEYGNDLPSQGGITGNGAGKLPQYKPGSVMGKIMGDEPVTDDRVAIEQGGASTQPFVPTQQELTSNGIGSLVNNPTIDLDRPAFELPYPNPTSMYEQTQNALAQGQYDAQNPRNRDKGFKGALKEALQNFAFGLSHAQPGMGFWESMALGGAGVGRGAVERSWNEQRKAQQELPMLQQNAKIASDEMDASQNRLYKKKQIENWQRDDDDRFLTSIRKRKYFDPAKMSQVEKDRLASLGYAPEDIGSWDDRDGSKTVKWGDSIFSYNPSTGKYEDAGMGKDPTLKPTEYVVTETNDDGTPKMGIDGKPITKTFITTSKGAANLQEMANFRKANIAMAGKRLTQDADQFNQTLEFNKQKDAALTAGRNAALDLRRQIFEFSKTNPAAAQKAQAQHNALKQRMKERVQEGKMSQEDFDAMFVEDAGFGDATGEIEKP